MNKNFLLLTTITIGVFLLLALGTAIAYQASSNNIRSIDGQIAALDKRLGSNQAQIGQLIVDKQLLSNNVEISAEKQRQMVALLNQVAIDQAAAAAAKTATVTPAKTTTVVKPATTTVKKTTSTTTKTTTSTPVVRKTRAS